MKNTKKVIYIVIAIIIIAAVAYGSYWLANKNNTNTNTDNKKVGQAVFLDNGQVYFGNVSDANSKTVQLKDIYYLQVSQPLQAAQDGGQNTATKNSRSSSSDSSDSSDSTKQPNVSLVKLGEELHGPKDEMKINHDHILFIEDMKSDSKVNQAIASYVKNGGNSTKVSNSDNSNNSDSKNK